MPKLKRASASCQGVCTSPIFVNDTTYPIIAMRSTYLLPKRVTALPEKGIVSNCPAGNASKILPKPASLSCKAFLISGIRLAQLANDKPWQKKNTATAVRACSLLKVSGMMAFVSKMDAKLIEFVSGCGRMQADGACFIFLLLKRCLSCC